MTTSSEEAPRATRGWNLSTREAVTLAAILLATALVYLPSVGNGWVWDDWNQISGATPLHSWSGIGKSFIYDSWWFRDPSNLPQSAYYRPLQCVWFGLNYMMLGNHPAAWHLEKIGLELIGVILSFRLAQMLSGSTAIGLLTAALFGLLPANAEAVLWASAMCEPLSTVFEMGALCCLIGRKREAGFSRGLGLALLLYAGALLTHETAILFWLIVAAYAFLIEQRRAGAGLRLAAPFLLLAVAYLGARLNALGPSRMLGLPHFQMPVVVLGWQAETPAPGALGFVATIPVVLLTYLEVLAVPGVAGPGHDVGWIASVSAITLTSAGALAIAAVAAWAIIRRSPDRRLYLFCIAWSLLTIAPAMKLNALATLVQDRVLYAPAFGWSLAVGLAATRLLMSGPRLRVAVAAAMALIAAAYAVSIVRLDGYWHDDLTFFARAVARDPHNAEFLRQLVDMLNQKGDFTGAMETLRGAVAQDPDNPYLHGRLASQYAMMQRGADFQAEMLEIRALHGKARAAGSRPAIETSTPTAIASP